MQEHPRIEDLRRRVEKDPASIAFAQLAEEYRRGGRYHEAVDVCRAGLAVHPGYLSARVTLGRALLEIGELASAKQELELVLKGAPENLAAIRGLAEIHHQQGDLPEALAHYQMALGLARNDPDLEQAVEDLSRQLASDHLATLPDLSLEPLSLPATELAAAADGAVPIAERHEPFDPERDRALRTIAALGQWLDAIHVARASRGA
jgi:tetratricopeptide (TPR) repeat protein